MARQWWCDSQVGLIPVKPVARCADPCCKGICVELTRSIGPYKKGQKIWTHEVVDKKLGKGKGIFWARTTQRGFEYLRALPTASDCSICQKFAKFVKGRVKGSEHEVG